MSASCHGLSGNRVVGHVDAVHTQVSQLLRAMRDPMKAILDMAYMDILFCRSRYPGEKFRF